MALKLNAGRAKVNDMLWHRRGKDMNSSSSYAELAQEADDSDADADRSPFAEGSHGANEATEVKVVDKSRKLWSRRKGYVKRALSPTIISMRRPIISNRVNMNVRFIFRKSKSPSPSTGSPKKNPTARATSGSSAENSPTHEKGYAISRCTKPVKIAQVRLVYANLHGLKVLS